jgi:hypothetical protein
MGDNWDTLATGAAMAGTPLLGPAAPLVPIAMGAYQLISGMQKEKQAQSLFPSIPPIWYTMMQDWKRKQRNAEVGTLNQNAINTARNVVGAGNASLLATGNPSAYYLAQDKTANIMSQLLGNVQKQGDFYGQQAAEMGNKIGAGQFHLAEQKYGNAMTSAMDNQRQGWATLLAGFQQNRMPKTRISSMLTNYNQPPLLDYNPNSQEQAMEDATAARYGKNPPPANNPAQYPITTPTLSTIPYADTYNRLLNQRFNSVTGQWQ